MEGTQGQGDSWDNLGETTVTADYRTWKEGFIVSQSVLNVCLAGDLGQVFGPLGIPFPYLCPESWHGLE